MNLNTRLLLSLSAVFFAILGVGITFLPQELLAYVGVPANSKIVLVVQLLGALYLGFAVLNWMSRGSHMGGIYQRPISLPNFFNVAIGGAALVKLLIADEFELEVAVLALLYSGFAVWFGLVVFTHPR